MHVAYAPSRAQTFQAICTLPHTLLQIQVEIDSAFVRNRSADSQSDYYVSV